MPNPEPKYNIGDLVMSAGVVRIESRTYVPELGWRYGLHYRQANLDEGQIALNMSGGGGFWYNEADLHPITDPVLVLRAEYTKRQERLKKLDLERKTLSSQMDYIEFSYGMIMVSSKEETPGASEEIR